MTGSYLLFKRITLFFWAISLVSLNACKQDDSYAYSLEEVVGNGANASVRMLSLGDSYTKGKGVCETCSYPFQLKDELYSTLENINTIELDVIAQNGWTTTDLINGISEEDPGTDYNLVTLLIGVNNQYRGLPFSQYEIHFPQLVDTAIERAAGRADKVIVISIPDYAYTPFGQNSSNPAEISLEIDMYNAFARTYCENRNISFVEVTDISRMGLDNPELVASDGLHLSELAYSRFVERLMPVALEKIE